MDNKIFNINGEGKPLLAKVLELAFLQYNYTPRAYIIDPMKGLIILWSDSVKDCQKFITPPTAPVLAEMVFNWLSTDEANKIPHTDWDIDTRHDGSNSIGWRVYCEDWGHVGSNRYSIIAIKPAYLWFGK